MKICIVCNIEQREELRAKGWNEAVIVEFFDSVPSVSTGYDAYFILLPHTEKNAGQYLEAFGSKPVFLNCVSTTLEKLSAPNHIYRLCAWPGFLKRAVWEVATLHDKAARDVMNRLGWKLVFVEDVPGLVVPRVLAMIIHEAYFALNEGVSTREEIDKAMKLALNYPYGPFEWESLIGASNITNLLSVLATTSNQNEIQKS